MIVWLTRACRRITLNLTFCHYTNQTVPSFRFSTYQQNHQSKVWGFDSFLVPFSTLTSIRRIRKRSTIKSSVKKKKYTFRLDPFSFPELLVLRNKSSGNENEVDPENRNVNLRGRPEGTHCHWISCSNFHENWGELSL